MPNDMQSVIEPKSDQINADDLIAGDMTITITAVTVNSGQEQPVSIRFAGSEKVFRPCKSMARVLVAVWGPDSSRYVGRSLQLYRDPEVTWGGVKVGGIRIRAMSDMERPVTIALTEKRGSRKPAVIRPLVIEQPPAAPDPADAVMAAKDAARRGTEAFRAWWASAEGKACRQIVTPIIEELRKIAAEADAAMEADPFGLPPVSDE